MMKRKNGVAIIIGLLLLMALFACTERKGTLNPNAKPVISITSYAGVEEEVDMEEIIFQQRIHWSASVADGGILGYAFRVLEYDADSPNGEGAPLATNRWEAIDADGWVYHYKDDVIVNEFTPPLDSPDAAELRQIWTKRVFVTINFPANGEPKTDENGNIMYDEFGSIIYEPVASIFQVKCISERGEESDISSKIFYAQSGTPKARLFSKFEDQILGRGGKFEFEIQDPDSQIAGVSALAREFQFAFLKGYRDSVVTENGTVFTFVPSVDDYGMIQLDANGIPTNYNDWDWISTKDEADVNVFRIPNRNPLYSDLTLKPNIAELEEGATEIPTPADSDEATFLFMRVIDLSNIVSDVEHVRFYVYGNFSPQTLLYLSDTFIIGQNHFQPAFEPGLLKVIPSQQTSSGVIYSKRFWQNFEREYEVIGSNDIKFYFHWGWKGEYGTVSVGGIPVTNPWFIRDNEVHDKNIITNQGVPFNYNSEIVYFDVRLNHEPLFYAPVPAVGQNLHVDEDGTRWLRVSRNDAFFQKLIISSTTLMASSQSPGLFGTHVLEVRAVDLQGVADQDYPVFEFNIVQKVDKAEKNGILLINSASANMATVEEKYVEILDTLGEPYDIVNYADVPKLGPDVFYFEKDKISPTDMQHYKLVIFNQDVEPHLNPMFHREYTTLFSYANTGGNLVATGGYNLRSSHITSYNDAYFPFQDFFGVGNQEMDFHYYGGNFLSKAFFTGASPDNGWSTDLNLELEAPMFSSNFINLAQGLGPVGRLNNFSSNSTVLYRYVSKLPGSDNYSPFEGTGPVNADGDDIDPRDGYDEVNGAPVALKYQMNSGANCYLFAFPLLYMEMDGVKSLYQEIWNDLD
jgi:hypothetical protein